MHVMIDEETTLTKEIIPSSSYGLRSGSLGYFETLAQSISCLAPTCTPAILIPLVFVTAGSGTWLAYLLATLAVLLVGANINQFALRSASPGSIYSYVTIGLGPGMGLLTGWLLLSGYIIVLSCIEGQFTLYAAPFVKDVFHLSIEPAYLMICCSIFAYYIAWRDIKLSASIMLILEFCSITLILVLMGITLIHQKQIIDWNQIRLTGVSVHGLTMGLVFAIFGYTGFESAASLGSEVKSPLKNIPRAIIQSGLWSGIFYAICAYVMILGFSSAGQKLGGSEAVLISLASLNGIPFFGIILGLGAVISFFACMISCINTSSRLMFMMGHHGLLHSGLSKAHENNQTPHIAILFVTIIGAMPPLIMSACHCSLIDIIAWTGTLSAYAFISSYLLVSVAAPVYLYQLNKLKKRVRSVAC
jgi:amino acid transporter